MRKLLGAAALAAALVGSTMGAEAADKLVLQLKWVTQAQFAGYYVAKDKGLYKDVGLDVEIKPGGPDINPSQVIAAGGADVGLGRATAIAGLRPGLAAEDPIGMPLIGEHDGQDDHQPDPDEGEGLGIGDAVPDRDMAWDDIGPEADDQTEEAEQEDGDGQQEGVGLPACPEPVPDREQQASGD